MNFGIHDKRLAVTVHVAANNGGISAVILEMVNKDELENGMESTNPSMPILQRTHEVIRESRQCPNKVILNVVSSS